MSKQYQAALETVTGLADDKVIILPIRREWITKGPEPGTYTLHSGPYNAGQFTWLDTVHYIQRKKYSVAKLEYFNWWEIGR